MSGGIVPSASRQYLLLSGVFLILDDYSRFSMISPSLGRRLLRLTIDSFTTVDKINIITVNFAMTYG